MSRSRVSETDGWLRRSVAVIVALFWLAGAANSQTLPEKIDSLLSDKNLEHGLQAVVIKSLKTGKTLYERNPDSAMIPASNMKLLVSAAALDRLGPDYTCKTNVLATAHVGKRGVVEGDLVLQGGGDPVLGTSDLRAIAKQVYAKGVRKVTGDLVADDTLFDSTRLGWGWGWGDLPYYYSAQISALNLNRNVVDVWINAGKKSGDAATVTLDPATDYVQVECNAVTGAASSQKTISVDRMMGRNVIRVGGSIPLSARPTRPEEPITVEEPALYAGRVFRDELLRAGVLVVGRVKPGKAQSSASLLCEHRSPPLSKILRLLNKPSDNLIAEVLLKTLGAAKSKGTADAGTDAEKEFLKQIGLDLTGMQIADGSGLSRLNYVTARNVAGLLAYMHSHKNSQVFIDSLPVAGVDGTLKNRMKNTSAERNVHAKTGYINRVSSLSGYVTTKSGEPLVFSILMNHHLCPNAPATKVQDSICALLADLP